MGQGVETSAGHGGITCVLQHNLHVFKMTQKEPNSPKEQEYYIICTRTKQEETVYGRHMQKSYVCSFSV